MLNCCVGLYFQKGVLLLVFSTYNIIEGNFQRSLIFMDFMDFLPFENFMLSEYTHTTHVHIYLYNTYIHISLLTSIRFLKKDTNGGLRSLLAWLIASCSCLMGLYWEAEGVKEEIYM